MDELASGNMLAGSLAGGQGEVGVRSGNPINNSEDRRQRNNAMQFAISLNSMKQEPERLVGTLVADAEKIFSFLMAGEK